MKIFKSILKIESVILIAIAVIGYFYISIENEMNPIFNFSVDEGLWIRRSYNYIIFLKSFDFVSALQTIHPGITVMLFSGISLHFVDYLFGINDFYKNYFSDLYKISFSAPIIMFMIVFFFTFYKILRKLKFNYIISYIILIFFSIKVFYITNTTPTDKYLSMSLLLSFGLLLIYVNKGYKNRKYLYLASFFAAFAILSKMSGFILLPYSIFILFYYSALTEKNYYKIIGDSFKYLMFFVLSAVLIFPGFLFSPFSSVNKILNTGNNFLVSGLGSSEVHFTVSQKIVEYFGFFLIGGYNAIITGFLMVFIIFFAPKYFKRGLKNDYSEQNLYYKNILILFSFALIYFIFVIFFASSIFYRYLTPSLMIFDIVAAIGFYEIIKWYKNKFASKSNINKIAVQFIIIFYIFQFFQLYLISQFVVLIKI
ncbi:MAG: hypothetical protein U9P70_04200 [Patescibacteria group bacterium]|nr:hypothetical protein [Patescibacteria group bacterium]